MTTLIMRVHSASLDRQEACGTPLISIEMPVIGRDALHCGIFIINSALNVSKQANIVLIGPMGAGKTTVGRQLAQQLRLSFVDSDQEIEKRTGVDISTIFEFEGEDGFRQREAAMMAELGAHEGIVLATGGGSVIRAENRACLQQAGFVVYLYTPVSVQLRRTARDRKRPLLQTENPKERLQALFSERDPLYREIADLVVDTSGEHLRGTVRQIIKGFKAQTAM